MTWVPLRTKGAKLLPWPENWSKLFTEEGGKFKFSAQGSNFALFGGNWNKVKILF